MIELLLFHEKCPAGGEIARGEDGKVFTCGETLEELIANIKGNIADKFPDDHLRPTIVKLHCSGHSLIIE